MALYAIMGIQLFGRMDYHCVLPSSRITQLFPTKIYNFPYYFVLLTIF
uniref:Uncharacterized protein n=1 Tax=Heterorhabditis bacteriophora TaxID=37862 RepID=A0A1I7W7W1_HETBA